MAELNQDQPLEDMLENISFRKTISKNTGNQYRAIVLEFKEGYDFSKLVLLDSSEGRLVEAFVDGEITP